MGPPKPCSRCVKLDQLMKTPMTQTTQPIAENARNNRSIRRFIASPNEKISGRSQPLVMVDWSLSESAGFGALHPLARHAGVSLPQPRSTPRPTPGALRPWGLDHDETGN